MRVPEGQPKIAHRFNGGFTSENRLKSQRAGRSPVTPCRKFGRPFGACSDLFAPPTVETVGYFHSPLTGPGLAARILAAKQRDADADVSALEREIDQLVCALYGLTPDEIRIVEGTAR